MGLFGIIKGVAGIFKRKGKNKGKGLFGLRKLFKTKKFKAFHGNSSSMNEDTPNYMGPLNEGQQWTESGSLPTNSPPPRSSERGGILDTLQGILTGQRADGSDPLDFSNRFKLPHVRVDTEVDAKPGGGITKIILIAGAVILAVVGFIKLMGGKKGHNKK